MTIRNRHRFVFEDLLHRHDDVERDVQFVGDPVRAGSVDPFGPRVVC